MNRQTREKIFKSEVRKHILLRDSGCIFCKVGRWEIPEDYGKRILDIAHIVNRSQGGLGIKENGVTLCRNHHQLLDNGNKGWRGEMQQYMEEYMRQWYPEWNRDKLLYRKEDAGVKRYRGKK